MQSIVTASDVNQENVNAKNKISDEARRESFGRFPRALLNFAAHDLSLSQVITWLGYSAFYNPVHHGAYPRPDTVARVCGQSVRTVRRNVKALVEAGHWKSRRLYDDLGRWNRGYRWDCPEKDWIRTYQKRYRPDGMRPAAYLCWIVLNYSGKIRKARLAQMTGLSPGTVRRSIDELVRDGYVEETKRPGIRSPYVRLITFKGVDNWGVDNSEARRIGKKTGSRSAQDWSHIKNRTDRCVEQTPLPPTEIDSESQRPLRSVPGVEGKIKESTTPSPPRPVSKRQRGLATPKQRPPRLSRELRGQIREMIEAICFDKVELTEQWRTPRSWELEKVARKWAGQGVSLEVIDEVLREIRVPAGGVLDMLLSRRHQGATAPPTSPDTSERNDDMDAADPLWERPPLSEPKDPNEYDAYHVRDRVWRVETKNGASSTHVDLDRDQPCLRKTCPKGCQHEIRALQGEKARQCHLKMEQNAQQTSATELSTSNPSAISSPMVL